VRVGAMSPRAVVAVAVALAGALAGASWASWSSAAEANPPAATAASCNQSLGARVFELCSACHSLKAEDAPREGPTLRGILDAKAATVDARYAYSAVPKGSGWTWDRATLDRFITNPRRALPGTTMTFIGLKAAEERAAGICYLDAGPAG
jgi:cytochrome c2